MFAKLYETDLGQILVKLDSGDDGPEVRYFFQPEGLGVCSVSANFKDLDEDTAWDNADCLFDDCTEESAFKVVKLILETLSDPG
jgi:hypothetical protein